MLSSPDESSSCSCCPYPGSFSHAGQEIGPHDSDNMAYASATTTSPNKSPRPLEYHQLSDHRSRRQHTGPGPATTAAGTWDSASTIAPIAPPETADEAAPGQDDWIKIEAMSQRASELLYPGPSQGPSKRHRYEFEADTPLSRAAAPRATTSHPATCMDVLRADIERAIQTHLGNLKSIELNCTGEGDLHMHARSAPDSSAPSPQCPDLARCKLIKVEVQWLHLANIVAFGVGSAICGAAPNMKA
ncbi:hypothetical protein MY11210_009226 [Beauveria gryllotalpidicola]